MKFDVNTVIPVYSPSHGCTFSSSYYLSNYEPTSECSAYRAMRHDICSKINESDAGTVSVSLVCNGFPVLVLKGDFTWYKQIEYFTKFCSSGGQETSDSPDSHGFIDPVRGIRIEFENGVLQVLPY